MMKLFGTLSIITISMLCAYTSTAQIYGNEWIDFDKTYYKIKVAKDGVYRVNSQTLIDAGLPMSDIVGDDFTMYAYGEEYPIFVSTSEGFISDDFIEFYGEKNRGQVDAQLYEDPETMQLNPEYSLFNDTMVYFLTWDDTETHNRIEQIENDLSNNILEPEAYYMAEEKLILSNEYNKPTKPGDHTRFAHYDFGEGYGSKSVEHVVVELEVENVYEDIDDLLLKVRTGSNAGNHNQEIIFNNNKVDNRDFNGYNLQQYNTKLSIEDLKSTNKIEIVGTNENITDRSTVSIVSIVYPRQFQSDGDKLYGFRLIPSLENRYIEIEMESILDGGYIVYDRTNRNRLQAEIDSNQNKLKFLVNSSLEDVEIIVFRENIVENVVDIEKRSFVDLESVDASYLLLTSEKLRSDINGNDWPQEYANFRETTIGGSYRTYVMNVEDLYDQFAFGVERHSIAIRNMGLFCASKWTELEYVFIAGKGLDFTYIRTGQKIQETNHLFFVPTFGTPPADNLLFTKQGENTPYLFVGRLAAVKPDQIKDYLDKAIANATVYDDENTIENNPWTKKIIHLGGGSIDDREQIKNNFIRLEDEISNNGFGANVVSYYKSSSEAISTSVSDGIINQINEGTSIIAFFGHSAVGTLDYSIGRAEVYDNKDRYPVFLSLGCLAGNIHTKGVQGISENYILTKDKGAIAFVASSFTAHIHKLYSLTDHLYEKLGSSENGLTLGEGLSYAIKTLDDDEYNSVILTEELTLHGDPAILLHTKKSPDYRPEFSSLSITPEIVNAALDSFSFSIDILNLGRAVHDSIYVKWRHVSPIGDTLFEDELKIKTPKYRNTYSFSIPLSSNEILGENTIYLQLDSRDEVDEYPFSIAESNNYLMNENGVLGYTFFIIDNNLMPIYPTEFGIVNNKDLVLLSSGSNVFLEDQKYIIQIDTSELFETILDQEEIIQGGGLLSWKPEVNYQEEQVYYWRVSPDSTDVNVGYVWNSSSFVFLENSNEGWNQSHYYQLKKDKYKDLLIEKNNKLIFGLDFLDIRLKNGYSDGDHKIEVFVSGLKYLDLMNHQSAPCIIVAAVDSLGGYLWNGPLGDFGSFNPTTGLSYEQPIRGFYYDTRDYESRQGLINFVENVIPDGYFVYFYTDLYANNRNLAIEEWDQDVSQPDGKSLYTVMETQGASRIREFEEKGAVPYNFIYVKGSSVLSEVVFEPEVDEFIESNTQIKGRWHKGTMVSKIIGPANKWNTMEWSELPSINQENDTTNLTILLLNENKIIVDTLFYKVTDKNLALSSIDALNYPYIKMVYSTKDVNDKTPTNFDYWRVYYDRVPELALNPALKSSFHADSIYRGDILKYGVTLSNITGRDMDSVLVKYVVTDIRNEEIITYKRLSPLKANSNTELSYSFDTKVLNDDFYFNIEVNPNNDQLEQYHFNNIGLKRINLIKDITNPLLDVFFDGIKIMDNDIVSPKPIIRIDLKDNSPFMLTQDVNLFKLSLRSPNGGTTNIDMNSDEVSFFPADNEDNKAYIEYRPSFSVDGIYSLTVQAKDASDNISGDNDYRVNFNVVLAQKVTSIINYPNPFSTSTQFIFTLTGAELPQDFKIQIMSVSGKVVREITESELGNMHIGLNRSEYLWDGTDDFGEKLGNGVYFYKVNMKKSDGSDYEHIETSIDQYYKQGWGKLVIMR